MEPNHYYEPSPVETLAEARSTYARLSGVVGALSVRASALVLIVVLLATLTGTALVGVITAKLEFAAFPYGVLPSLALLGAFLTYKALEAYLDLIATKRSLNELLTIYERAIVDADIAMPLKGLS